MDIPLRDYLEEKFNHVNDKLHSVEVNQQLLRQEQQNHGKRLASLPCHTHQRRLSQLTEALQAERENSQVHIIHDRVTAAERQRILKLSLAIAGTIAAALGTVWAILR